MTFPVVLRLYDLSRGLATQLSPSLLGQQINGIWHTGVFVYGREYFYGGGGTGSGSQSGISSTGSTDFSSMNGLHPVQEIPLGNTHKTKREFEAFLQRIAGRFRCEDYSLFNHNCNNFSDTVSQFLVGKPIPTFITGLPARVLASPMGAALRPFMDNFNNNFQSQMSTPQTQGRLQHYNMSTPSSSTPPATNAVASALDDALAALEQEPQSSTTTAGSTAPSSTTTKPAPAVTAVRTRLSVCPLTKFGDDSLIPGMVRRLTTLASRLEIQIPNIVDVLKKVRVNQLLLTKS